MIKGVSLALLSVLGLKLGRAILPYFGSKFIPPSQKYVIVTGCTDGLGKQYARYLTQLGIPLILVGRNQGKLQQENKELLSISPQKQQVNKILKIDYSDTNLTLESYLHKFQSLNLPSKSVSGIINCCGVAYLQKLHQISWNQMQNVKQVNTTSLELALRSLKQNYMCQQPFIMNVSSYASHYPMAYSAVYSASKAYSSNLLLAYTKQNKQVKTLSVEPWYVKTKMTGFINTWDSVEPKQIVEGSMKVVGKRKRCSGCIKHQILYEFKYFLEKYNDSKIQERYARIEYVQNLKKKRLSKQKESKKEQPEK